MVITGRGEEKEGSTSVRKQSTVGQGPLGGVVIDVLFDTIFQLAVKSYARTDTPFSYLDTLNPGPPSVFSIDSNIKLPDINRDRDG